MRLSIIALGMMLMAVCSAFAADGADNVADNSAFEAFKPFYEKWSKENGPLTDYHIHLRGGMTPETSLDREKETGIKSAVLENAGREWPLNSDEKINALADSVRAVSETMPVGLQVNDRDWYKAISSETLARLDFILADTMIMGTNPDGSACRLWLLPDDYEADLDEWMERYMAHYRQILDEPITILANPTYLPKFAAGHYDELWTEERMAEVIDKAVEKGIALEIQAESPYPSDRFIEMAVEKGAVFSFGTNNFDAKLKKLDRWEEVLTKFTEMKIFSLQKK